MAVRDKRGATPQEGDEPQFAALRNGSTRVFPSGHESLMTLRGWSGWFSQSPPSSPTKMGWPGPASACSATNYLAASNR